jgi:GTP-binding protein Era
MTKAGIVTVAGKPNAGKSTTLNRLVGQKLSITSEKPQSTRDRVVGIRTSDAAQMVILDTPGLLDPAYALQVAMRNTALAALADADVVLYLVDARDTAESGHITPLHEAAGVATPFAAPVLTALNKADLLTRDQRERLEVQHPEALFISALTGEGFDALLTNVQAKLPDSPFLYPEDDISTQSLRFFAAELVRETALEQLDQEVPYSIACEIEEFREDRSPVYVRAVIYVERESQKRILIGEKGQRIRAIGSAARKKIETLVGQRVYLDLWVKVLQNWRKDAGALRRFGYSQSPGSPS